MTYNLFDLGWTPTATNVDPMPITVGTEFIANSDCWVTEIGWFRGDQDSSNEIRQGGIYQKPDVEGWEGTLLAGPFDLPLPAWGNWGTYVLPTPLKLTAGKTYRAAVYHPGGCYAAVSKWFLDGPNAQPIVRGPITIPNTQDTQQGSYNYATGMSWPSQSFNGSAYFSDATITDVDPSAPPTDTLRSWNGTQWVDSSPVIATKQRLADAWVDVDLKYFHEGWKTFL